MSTKCVNCGIEGDASDPPHTPARRWATHRLLKVGVFDIANRRLVGVAHHIHPVCIMSYLDTHPELALTSLTDHMIEAESTT